MAASVIEVRDVAKAFTRPAVRRNTLREHVFAGFRRRAMQRFTVLDGVTFDLRPGEALGLMGANGCGKSTLLKIICGIYVADRGTVVRRAPITSILELGVGWNSELDAVDNIYLVGSIMGLSLSQIHSGLDEILGFAELEAFANMKLKHYSSGMAARLAFDDRTGKVVWETNLGSPVSGYPITFAVDGKQYVAVATGPSGVATATLRLTPELKPSNAGQMYVFALP